MIYVSMLQFLRSGHFGPLRLGMAPEQVRALVGQPELFANDRRGRPRIWKYGDVELHYTDKLWLIHLENFTVPRAGKSMRLDPWIIRRGLSRRAIEQQLAASGIAYREVESLDPSCTWLRVGAGVTLILVNENDEDGAPPGLWAISYSCAYNISRTY